MQDVGECHWKCGEISDKWLNKELSTIQNWYRWSKTIERISKYKVNKTNKKKKQKWKINKQAIASDASYKTAGSTNKTLQPTQKPTKCQSEQSTSASWCCLFCGRPSSTPLSRLAFSICLPSGRAINSQNFWQVPGQRPMSSLWTPTIAM